MASFIETPTFPEEVGAWAVGGPSFNTTVVVVAGGAEKRNINWSVNRGVYDISNGFRTLANAQATLNFFNAVYARAYGFRFKDWRDYSATISTGRMGIAAVGDGYPTKQMYKRYTAGVNTYDRLIEKPVAANPTPLFYKNGSLLTVTTNYTLDSTTGIVTYVPTISKTITGITKANPGVVTATSHGFTNGQLVYISGVVGMTQVNSLAFTVTVVNANSFSIGVNTSSYTTYSSGGTAALYPQAADTLTFAADFDVPCRFDTDLSKLGQDPGGLLSWQNVMIVELRPEGA